MAQLHDLTALEAAAAVRRKEVSPVELVEHALARIAGLDDQIGAFVTVTAERAREQARAAEAAVLDGADLPALHGVPTAIKDLNLTAGIPTKFGSRTMADFVPDFDDNVVTLLRAAGTISVGKTATPEFGLPCYTETDIGPPARTPWDTARLAGGSSGGAAAAVASGFVPVAQGSDGGGSIRIPASVCGLVGLKPSRGRVSRGPLDLDSSRLSVLGPLARTVRDAAAFLDAVAIPQPGDPDPPPPLPAGETLPRLVRARPGTAADRPVTSSRRSRPSSTRRCGPPGSRPARCSPASATSSRTSPRPSRPRPCPAFETVWAVGAATIPIDPAHEAKLRPLTRHLRERGRAVSGPDYANALGQLNVFARRGHRRDRAPRRRARPVAGDAAAPGRLVHRRAADDPAADFERQKQFTPYTAIYNTTGQPAISLPLYQSEAGLPIGMMLVGRPGGEAALLALAAQVEAALPWRDRHPAIWDAQPPAG